MYGLCFWGVSAGMNAVFIAQKRIIRVISGAPPGSPCGQLFRELQLLPLPCLYIKQSAIYVYKNLGLYSRVQQIHGHETRGGGDIYIDRCRLNVSSKSPFQYGARIFNALPRDIKSAVSITEFKRKLSDYLLDRMFYKIDDVFA